MIPAGICYINYEDQPRSGYVKGVFFLVWPYETQKPYPKWALENNRSQFINAMKSTLDMMMSKYLKLWEWSDFIHKLTTGRKIKRQIKFMEDFIKSVIQEKKKQYLSGNKDNVKGKRKAFMDLLLELHFETQELSEQDIQDEVNTFIAAVFIKLTPAPFFLHNTGTI
ncbi:cytochrome P450 4V2 [Trichonephila inaurata madagascariensis]|uniref:Cytochrome P450 4V2 n=1 Tax=Trichonephila inaurata madagascariensis TaxID=2747483 RepID=A0A8X7CHY3_9ARAC|nr:cytochrome P450 4V2 [Trichonephila inaurata madagascariensis]